ncbi:hypothetical protein J6590_043117 [Homalodisca vitripennis]|nr:hypothetical protein J6590_043117 [Homalodisca vitripennis]
MFTPKLRTQLSGLLYLRYGGNESGGRPRKQVGAVVAGAGDVAPRRASRTDCRCRLRHPDGRRRRYYPSRQLWSHLCTVGPTNIDPMLSFGYCYF